MSGGHFVVENKPSPRKPRGTGAKPQAGSPDALVDTPAPDVAAATPDTESPYVNPEEVPDDTGPADAVASPEDQNDTAEIPTGSANDTAEIPTSIEVEVPASSPSEDRAVLLARLQLLETENARLRATATVPPPAPPAPRPRRKVGRSTAAVVLILIGALLAPIAVVGSWARGLVVDTDRYVDTVAPIAEDPLVQSAVANRITIAVVDALNVEELTTQATDAVAGLDLPPLVGQAVTSLQAPLQDAITGFIRKNVTKIVSSDAFENVWEEANRAAHEQIVATLRGDPDALAQISDSGTLTLDVTPIIEQVKTSLEEAGFTLVSRIPTINVTFPIASSADLVRLQSAYRLIDIVGGLLPYLSLALLAAGVLAAQHRSRALVVAGLSLAGAMLLLGLALTVGRSLYASSLPPTVQRVDTAVSIYDQFVSLLRIELRVGLVLGLLLAIIAFVAGGTTAARQLRASSSHASTWLRTAGERRGISTGPVGVWLDQQRILIRVVVISLAALALVLADRLTPAYVVGVFVVALVVLGLVTLASRPRSLAPVEEEEPVLV
ncbi:hypothetical protein [Cellulomonas sp. Root485]|uniref:hypothetical protein n=1 Tax=Cellulomonas sp. Root485 TaxID=1736546 RepID=UPI00190FC226|nr:hypothetical protein [Cellulomonas sp. Root485]